MKKPYVKYRSFVVSNQNKHSEQKNNEFEQTEDEVSIVDLTNETDPSIVEPSPPLTRSRARQMHYDFDFD